jgi:protein-disulfide isomerase
MSKLLSATLIATVVLSANEVQTQKVEPKKDTEVKKEVLSQKDLLKFIKRNVVRNPRVKVNKVEIVETKQDARLPGWDIIFSTMNLSFQKREMNAPLMIFKNGNLLTTELYDMKTGKSYSKEIKPNVSKKLYDDEHLLMGHKDAKHKILVFSDPQCPFCQDVMPDIFKAVKENPDTFALYYYHLPLKRLHPVSDALTRVMHVAQKDGKVDMATKMYQLNIDIRETNETKILNAIDKQFGYKVTKEQIDAKEVKDAIKADEDTAAKMMVGGTPTVYIDGKWDRLRNGYKKYLPKKK